LDFLPFDWYAGRGQVILAMPLDRASSTSPIFSARGFEDEVLLVAMDLLLDAYMQWFHIGSYRLAARFSQ
jgi:hypothetical protein